MPGQHVGRFDLGDQPPVRYLAETPDHAVGEAISGFRGTAFRPSYLRQHGLALALVPVTVTIALRERIADCTDPTTLARYHVRPDELAHHERAITQDVARRLHEADVGALAGFRWWSALTGAWHAVVLFTDRAAPADLAFGTPAVVKVGDPALVEAQTILGIR